VYQISELATTLSAEKPRRIDTIAGQIHLDLGRPETDSPSIAGFLFVDQRFPLSAS
jgi:hypothetical protein